MFLQDIIKTILQKNIESYNLSVNDALRFNGGPSKSQNLLTSKPELT